MGLPEDLKHYGVNEQDAFQLVPEDLAGGIVGAIVALLFIGDVLQRIGAWR